MSTKPTTQSKPMTPPAGGAAPPPRLLRRRPDNRVIAGVCSGLADYFQIDPILVRLAFVVVTFAGGTGVFAYIILWIADDTGDGRHPDSRLPPGSRARGPSG